MDNGVEVNSYIHAPVALFPMEEGQVLDLWLGDPQSRFCAKNIVAPFLQTCEKQVRTEYLMQMCVMPIFADAKWMCSIFRQ
jgi:hypothetical protein